MRVDCVWMGAAGQVPSRGELSGAVQLTSPCCNGAGIFTAGGTLAPILLGGFTPATGQEFDLFALDGGKFEGTFAALANGFTADYAHEASEPAFVGIVYGASAGGAPGSGLAAKPKLQVVQVGSISHKQGKPTVTLSGPTGGAACQVVSVRATVIEHLKGGKITAVSAQGQEESCGEEEAGGGRDRQRNAGGRGLQDAYAHTQRNRQRAAEEVREAHGDRDRQLGRYDDQHGDRPLAKGHKRKKEIIEA
jgi:hypothetical protein